MTQPYSHYIKQANTGFLGAPTGPSTPDPDDITLRLGVRPEHDWVTSKAPDPESRGEFYGTVPTLPPDNNTPASPMYPGYFTLHRTTPRAAFERNYGPALTERLRQNAMAYQEANPQAMARYGETGYMPNYLLTERLRQNAMAYQEAHPQAMARYGATSFMPNYSRVNFDAPHWVRQLREVDGKASMGVPYEAYTYNRAFSDEPAIVHMALDPSDSNYGTFDNPTDYYNSILQHESTHRLQPAVELDSEGRPVVREQRVLPGEDPSQVYAYGQPNYPAKWAHRPIILSAFDLSSMEPYRHSRFPHELAPMVSQAKLQYYNDLRRTSSLSNVEELMNFNDPNSYERFLSWMKSQEGTRRRGNYAGDIKWILKLPPEERDLYFKGIVSRQPISTEYRA